MDDSIARNISEAVRLTAAVRASESGRSDAVFKDPFAEALAGESGSPAARIKISLEDSWPFIARTYLFDRFVTRLVEHGVDMIISLAAGLDTRPYRMPLPKSLRWVEVDLPDILDYKESVLGDARPVCALERVRLDLTNEDARRGLFSRLGQSAQRVAVLSEGLVVYLMSHEVAGLARDLAAQPTFDYWLVDIASRRALESMREQLSGLLQEAGAPFLFAPSNGAAFFDDHGWRPQETKSLMRTAGRLGRLPLALRMLATLPEPSGRIGDRQWSAVVLLARMATAHP